jgi:hypothetical protein
MMLLAHSASMCFSFAHTDGLYLGENFPVSVDYCPLTSFHCNSLPTVIAAQTCSKTSSLSAPVVLPIQIETFASVLPETDDTSLSAPVVHATRYRFLAF